jgi:hypothetical protein
MHPFAIDARGGLYVNSGSATNACQVENRMPQSPGHRPCTELATRAGIWRYDANRTGQRFSATERFATGIPNAGGSAVDRHMGNIGKDDLAVRGRAYSHVQPRCHAHGHAGGPKSVTLRPYGAGTGLEARDRATISLADRNPSAA